MGRRIYIIANDFEITQAIIDEATVNNCSEIVKGIPPILKDIHGASLPLIYEEPEPKTKAVETRNILAEIDELKVRIASLEK